MTERNYFVAYIFERSNDWVGEDEGGRPSIVRGVQHARRFSLEEAEAFVEERLKGHNWVRWAIFKIDLMASYKDSPLKRLAGAADE